MTDRPMTKRIICGSAQGESEPPAIEASMTKPTDAVATSRTTSAQLRCSSFASPCGVRWTVCSR